VCFEALEERRLFSGGEPIDPIEPDGYEINDTPAQASDLGTINSASIDALTIHKEATRNDVDYFKFTAPASGAALAQINFIHQKGDLALGAYDANQTLITYSDSSSYTNNRETVNFSVQQGQTYFLRIGGQLNPNYSLSLKGISAAFDWNMPKRTGNLLDQFGLAMFPNTRDYARPDPIMINGVETPRYGVSLKALGATAGDGVNYQWYIGNGQYTTSVNGANPIVDLPQGQFNVQLVASASGQTITSSQTINVRDILVVGLGDSYGSGEGNPHSPQQYDWLGYTTRGAVWASSPDAQESTYSRMAHRSAYSPIAQAALQLENSDPKTSVTFVFLDHTGATINVGLLGDQPSGDPGAPGSTPPQVDRLKQIIGDRKIDELAITVGGNDLGFAKVLADLIAADPDVDGSGYRTKFDNIINTARDNILQLGSTWYPALAARLNQDFQIGQTYLMDYPDLTRDSTGDFAQKVLDDVLPFLEVDHWELANAYPQLLPSFMSTMKEACRQFGWTFVDGIHEAFHTHGYGDWLRTATESAILQGPLGHRDPASEQVARLQTTGTMHPMSGGLDAERDRLLDKIGLPDLITTDFTLSPGAFLPGGNSTFSLTVTNQSLYGSAGSSLAKIYLSADATVKGDDSDLLSVTVPVPAVAAGQSVTVTGVLPVLSSPYFSAGNLVFVAPKLDTENAVAEANDVNNVLVETSPLIRRVQADRDFTTAPNGPNGPYGLKVVGKPVAIGSTTAAKLGIDELIGDEDVDVFRVNATAGQRLGFDIDAAGSLDTYVQLYHIGNDTLLDNYPVASNDNGAAPGETGGNALESYLEYTADQAGEYALVVSHKANAFAIPTSLPDRHHGATGDYSVSVSVVQGQPPAVLSSSFDLDQNRLSFQFSKDVGPSVTGSDLVVTNTGTGQVVPCLAAYESATNTARFTFSGFGAGLPAGNYRAVLAKDNVSDAAGNHMVADAVLDFFFLWGDANHDRAVNSVDFTALATNFGTGGKTFSQGDLNYDGAVNALDFNILASRFGTSVAPPPGSGQAPTLVAHSSGSSLFSTTPIGRQLGGASGEDDGGIQQLLA
jgi:hypothetical protein